MIKVIAILLITTGCAYAPEQPEPDRAMIDAWEAVLCGDNTTAAWCGGE